MVWGKGPVMSPRGSSSPLTFLVCIISPLERSLNFLEAPLGGLHICSWFNPLLRLLGSALEVVAFEMLPSRSVSVNWHRVPVAVFVAFPLLGKGRTPLGVGAELRRKN